ncbi:MAG TPA: hypothetical protein VE449_02620 [Thermoleophilaceae bacterium]|jgi:hypothetical protein|nr:hypothetical protein [Thermoleophilaceae bacterium]
MTTVKTLANRPAAHFARHYVEMVLAMFAGMIALGIPAGVALGGFGIDLTEDAPAAILLGMGITMTVPMVAWMRYRGHGWAASNEMAASMMVPTLGVVALLAGGLVDDTHALLVIQHVVMFPAMLAVMFLRLDEYAHTH